MSKICNLQSGGIDSFIAYRMLKAGDLTAFMNYSTDKGEIHTPDEIIPLFVNCGQPYFTKEYESVKKLIPDVRLVTADLCTNALDNVPTVEKQEIKGRNTLLAFYGSLVGDVVTMAALNTEMTLKSVVDKRPEFFIETSKLFSLIRERPILVTTPFYNFTKTDIVSIALNNNLVTPDELKATVSCYDETHQNCGKCSTCFKRWVAMTNNDIDEDYSFHPYHDNNYAKNIASQMREECKSMTRSGRFTEKRFPETHSALIKHGIEGIF